MKDAAQRVYVVVHPRNVGDVKIGKTIRNPKHRLARYNTCCPDRLFSYAALVEVDNALAAERRLKRALKSRKRNGEWYRIPVPLAVALLEHLRKRSGSDGDV